MVRVFVIHRPIVREEIVFPLEPKWTGSILEFFQVVRGESGGHPIRAIRFEADRELLRSSLLSLANRIAQHYELTEFECFRRMGQVASGEPYLLVRIGAIHRDEAFRAMNEFLDELRAIAITANPVS